MLPRELSENICSLKPNCDRLAFVFKIKLNSNLEPISEELLSCIIHSKRRFNYDEVDSLINQEFECEKEIKNWLMPLFELTQKLKEKRLKNGFDFHTLELRMSLDKNGDISSTRFESSTPSHSLIEECMLLANKAAAKRINKGIFRNHAPADLKKINDLLNDLAVLGIEEQYDGDLVTMIAKIQVKASELGIREDVDKLIIKAQKRAEYSSNCTGHFGLGFEFYSHFTSPIRRYSDLILHRILKAGDDTKLTNYLMLGIDELCSSLNILEREADKVAWDFMDRKFARWAAKNIGQTFKCYIYESGNQTVAKLDDELKGARIFLNNFKGDILTTVRVKITDVDIPTAKIMGKVVEILDV